jgi:hypothetical protein
LKRTIFAVLAVLAVVALCGCAGVVISIDSILPSETPVVETYSFGMAYDGEDGNIYSESPEGYYAEGTEITAHAVCADGMAFYAWSVGGYLDDGGTAVSYDKDLTFSIYTDTYLYANFRSHDTALVYYHGNGGTAVETGEDTLWKEFSLDYYLYPNTLPDMGYFERDGYTLVGYNTEPDGSGNYYNVGGKAFEDTDAVIELYCIWSEQTPSRYFSFEYNRSYGGWFVTSYLGDDEAVSIPTTFNDEPVVGVSAGAFSGNSTVTSIVFPSCIQVIEDYSCNSCENLTTVVIYDSLEQISDDSFDSDENLNRVYINAATNPKYSTWFNNHTKKIEIMNYWKDSDRPKLICIGGSSTTYAVDAELLESLLDRDYLVLNIGSNGANLFNMTSEWAMHFLKEGDFLLHIPEYSFWQLGGVQCRWETFRSFESCYNIFSWINLSKYTEFFNSFQSYLEARSSMTDMTYEDYTSTLAPNGYYDIQGTLNVVTKANGSSDFWSGRSIYFCDDWLYSFMIYYVNVQYWKLDQMGVDYAMAFTPLNRNSLYDYQTDEAMDDFEDYLAENLNVDIISDLQENIYDPEVFFDDDYHLAAPAREEYTRKLAEDLNAYFATLDADQDN